MTARCPRERPRFRGRLAAPPPMSPRGASGELPALLVRPFHASPIARISAPRRRLRLSDARCGPPCSPPRRSAPPQAFTSLRNRLRPRPREATLGDRQRSLIAHAARAAADREDVSGSWPFHRDPRLAASPLHWNRHLRADAPTQKGASSRRSAVSRTECRGSPHQAPQACAPRMVDSPRAQPACAWPDRWSRRNAMTCHAFRCSAPQIQPPGQAGKVAAHKARCIMPASRAIEPGRATPVRLERAGPPSGDFSAFVAGT